MSFAQVNYNFTFVLNKPCGLLRNSVNGLLGLVEIGEREFWGKNLWAAHRYFRKLEKMNNHAPGKLTNPEKSQAMVSINSVMPLKMKKLVKILGVGSSRDRVLMESVQMAADELGIILEIQLISDIEAFLKMGITAIPALVIEDRVVANGRVPGVTEIKNMLREANAA